MSIRIICLLVALFATACRKPRGWSLSPTTPSTLTMRTAGQNGIDFRVTISIPPNYHKARRSLDSAEWHTPNGRGASPDNSPILSLTIMDGVAGDTMFPNGCNVPDDMPPQPLYVHSVRPDLRVSRCGDKATGSVSDIYAFYTMTLQPQRDPRTIILWCGFTFYRGGGDQNKDYDDAESICSSILWQPLETELPADSGEDSTPVEDGRP